MGWQKEQCKGSAVMGSTNTGVSRCSCCCCCMIDDKLQHRRRRGERGKTRSLLGKERWRAAAPAAGHCHKFKQLQGECREVSGVAVGTTGKGTRTHLPGTSFQGGLCAGGAKRWRYDTLLVPLIGGEQPPIGRSKNYFQNPVTPADSVGFACFPPPIVIGVPTCRECSLALGLVHSELPTDRSQSIALRFPQNTRSPVHLQRDPLDR